MVGWSPLSCLNLRWSCSIWSDETGGGKKKRKEKASLTSELRAAGGRLGPHPHPPVGLVLGPCPAKAKPRARCRSRGRACHSSGQHGSGVTGSDPSATGELLLLAKRTNVNQVTLSFLSYRHVWLSPLPLLKVGVFPDEKGASCVTY